MAVVEPEAAERLRFAGYAALFDVRDAARDVIRPGAFARTLAARAAQWLGPLPLYWQHRPDMRIGWVEQAAEDERGLRVTAMLDDPHGLVIPAVKAGKVTGLSIGYRARGFIRDAQGRELRDIDLIEVSLVHHPMQPGACIHLVGAA